MKCKVIDISYDKTYNQFSREITFYEYVATLQSPYGLITKTESYIRDKESIPKAGDVVEHTHISTIKRLSDRLLKLGVELKFIGNYPWVYLSEVNGIKVNGKLLSDHSFTAFTNGVNGFRWVDMSKVFKKVRETLEDN